MQDIAQDSAKSRDSVEYIEKILPMNTRKKADPFVGVETLQPINRAAEKALNRKLDLWVMPLLTLNFMFAFVDRSVFFSYPLFILWHALV
jgi:hypothetical protein